VAEDLTVPGPDELGAEARLLLALAQPDPALVEAELLRAYLVASGRELDWGWFLDQAARQGVLPLVARNVVQLRIGHSASLRGAVPYEWLYQYAYSGNRARNDAMAAEQERIFQALTERGVGFAVRKGAVLLREIYADDYGARRVGDLDVLVRPGDLAAFAEVLRGLGYDQGQPDVAGESIDKFDRVTQIFWRSRLTHVTLPFMRISSAPEIEAFIVDPCLSIFPPGYLAGIEETQQVLDRRVATQVWSTAAWSMDPADVLLDLCVQFHAEATTLHYISIGKDLTVAKLLELAVLCRRATESTSSGLISRSGQYQCLDSVHYALHFAHALYPDAIADSLLAASRPRSLDYLEEFGGFDGKPARWQRSFYQRLFDPRWRAGNATSRIPGPRARI
jgi:hypothetical protein